MKKLGEIKADFMSHLTVLRKNHPIFQSVSDNVVTPLGLSSEEHLILDISVLHHALPQELDSLIQFSDSGRPYTEIGGEYTQNFMGFTPTIQTVAFLLKVGNGQNLMNVLSLFRKGTRLLELDLISISDKAEAFVKNTFYATDNLFAMICEHESYQPQFSPSFPARKITTDLEWKDLVIEPHTFQALEEIKQWITHESAIMQQDHLKKRITPGYRSLFYGPSGTGKTLAATLIGKYTERDVYRIDLSMVVSKYIGETEKNLSNIFNTAEHKNWILFFDEADSLFSKRTNVKSSNDRYANQEVSYLLQRIEDFDGIVILASNLKGNMDSAFTRRFQSIIHFPMPKPKERLQLWKATFEGSDLATDVDVEQLAEKYELAGGIIANVLRTATLQSLHHNQPIHQNDLLAGIKKEFEKEGRIM